MIFKYYIIPLHYVLRRTLYRPAIMLYYLIKRVIIGRDRVLTNLAARSIRQNRELIAVSRR